MDNNPVVGALTVPNLLAHLIPQVCSCLGDDFDVRTLEKELSEQLERLRAGNLDLVVDELSRNYLEMTCLVLAAYTVLEPYVPDGASRGDLIEKAMCKILQPRIKQYVRDRFGVDENAPQEAFANVSQNFLDRGRKFLGTAFIYGEEKGAESERTFTVSRCFFFNFFRRHNLPRLTRVFCALDTIWASEFNEGPYNIAFDRPTVMSRGDDVCRFHFVRRDV